ncbi:hypothetical protein [Brevundimonas mediterranea]|uniref:DUF2269 family protein n=1 Tax=Brevundimonas mediterranea TaxID=74329 RepID=A0A7W6A2C7_9CAUL|nr:hypothetical protein [Brevundimonas mediterranea]MBB3871968.1 hypothetical protein [Brevundimonas mediterranea]
MAGLVLFAEWIVSAITGWLGWWLWLFVPPVVALFIAFSGNGRALNRMKEMGLADEEAERRFVDSVMGPSLKFVLWQAIINALIFIALLGARNLIAPT